MLIIEIAALDNGAHRNQTCHGIVPEGWAIIPDEMELPDTFPFVDIEVEGVFVVSMTAREIPVPEEPEPGQPVPDPVEKVTWAAMAEAITEGVNEV